MQNILQVSVNVSLDMNSLNPDDLLVLVLLMFYGVCAQTFQLFFFFFYSKSLMVFVVKSKMNALTFIATDFFLND